MSIQKYENLANKIKEGMKYDKENNVINEVEEHSVYNKNLPEGVTPEVIKNITNYNSEFINAAHIAVGDMAADIFKQNKNIENTTANIGFFGPKDSISITANRKMEFTNSFAKPGEEQTVVKNLHLKGVVEIKSNNGIGLKKIKEEISQTFAGRFSN